MAFKICSNTTSDNNIIVSMEVIEKVGSVPSSQPKIDGTEIDEEMNNIIRSQADHLNVWYKK
jgi:hypothetical protein